MITVFIILGLVVLSGQLLINIVNRFSPPNAIKSPLIDSNSMQVSNPSSSASKSQIAAIVAAVDIFTEGQGRIESIEKLD